MMYTIILYRYAHDIDRFDSRSDGTNRNTQYQSGHRHMYTTMCIPVARTGLGCYMYLLPIVHMEFNYLIALRSFKFIVIYILVTTINNINYSINIKGIPTMQFVNNY